MKNVFNKLSKSRFVRNVFTLSAGTLVSQVIIFVFSPVITRIYSPEVFGTLGIFMSIVTLVSPVIALMYPISIVLPDDDQEAISIFWLSLMINFFLSLFICGIIFLMDLLGVGVSFLQINYLYYACIVFVVNGAAQSFQYWLIRKMCYSVNALAEVLQSIFFNIIVVFVGCYYAAEWVLITAAIMRSLMYLLVLMYGSVRYTNILDVRLKLYDVVKVAKKYVSFPRYRMPQKIVNSLGLSVPVIFLGSNFGSSYSGYYSLSKSIIGVPVRLIGKSIADVFYPKLNESRKNLEDVYEQLLKTISILFILIVLPFTAFFVFSKDIFLLVYGAAWIEAGEYAKWISVWLFFGLINQPIVAAVSVLSLEKNYFNYEVISLFLRFCALMLSFVCYNSALMAIILYSCAAAICNIFLTIYVLYSAKNINIVQSCG